MKEQSHAALLLFLISLCIGVELVAWLSDIGVLSVRSLRSTIVEYAGFWPGLTRDWTPVYAVQPYTMFVSYAFVHGGPLHLGMNMLALWSLGTMTIVRTGSRGFLALYLASVLGGAVGYALLHPTLQPMVGASGGLFGLAGAFTAWVWHRTTSRPTGPKAALRIMAGLLALNVVLWVLLRGQLAWETHLGGFVAGWVFGLHLDRPTARETPR